MKTAPIHRRLLLLLPCLAVMAGGARAEDPPVAASPPPAVSTSAHASYTFPFTSLFYGAPVVQAKINDTVTATFLIDTGSSANFISQTVVDKLGLKPQDDHLTRDPSFLEGKQPMFVSPQKVLVLRHGRIEGYVLSISTPRKAAEWPQFQYLNSTMTGY